MGDGADDAERRALQEAEEEGVIGRQLVPSGGAPVTLFRTDDPMEIVGKATAIADALADVLKKKNLTSRISGKDYVQVEGWTLCGTMLGVYPVVEWTRQVEGGWEARVQAVTRDGSVVGAAESECLRTENRWRTADDYSIRSMAQTRAISKALRAPLGFIVALAGYEATPEDEMIRPEPQREFDIDRDLLPGAISGDEAPKRLADALNGFDPTVDWQETFGDMVLAFYGKPSWRELPGKQQQDWWRRLSNAVQFVTNTTPAGDLPPIEEEKIIAGFLYAFPTLVDPVLTYRGEEVIDESVQGQDAPLSEEQIKAVEEALAKDDDIPFGEEKKA